MVTEFGSFDCSTWYYEQIIPYMNAKQVSWTAWAWYPGGCAFPAVIQDWNGTPNAPGNVIKQALPRIDPLHWPFFPSTESP
ncbi:MAG: hypothetical protein R3F14_02190 [Polyangiaceae bacterium]